MFWILLPLLLIGLGFVFRYFGEARGDDWDILATLCWAFGAAIFLVALILIPVNRNWVMAGIERHEAIRQTVAITREMGEVTDLERIRLTEDIIGTNKNLAVAKYYARHPWFKLYYPKEVLNVEPIY